MRTFLLFLPFLLLRNELFVGTFVPLFCNRDSDDVDDEKDEDGVAAAFLRRGSELVFREPSFTFNFTLNISLCVSNVLLLLSSCVLFVCLRL